MPMQLVTVGTGTAAPSATRVQSAQLVRAGNATILLDCGSGAAHRLASLGARWQDITHLALSHFHADHTLDLTTLMYAWRYGQLPPRSEPLVLVGPEGMGAMIERLVAAFGETVRGRGFDVELIELASGARFERDDIAIGALKVPHTDESIALDIAIDGVRLVYSGDTGFDPSLGDWAHGADLFLCECSLPESLAIPTHLTPRQCGELAARAAPRQVVLTHFYPPVEQEDIRALVGESFGGAVALARDGDAFEV